MQSATPSKGALTIIDNPDEQVDRDGGWIPTTITQGY